MGYFIAMAVNPNPATNTNDRQWVALDQSGFIMTSHGLSVPVDTPTQPARPYTSGAPGNFTVPRFGWAGAYIAAYAQDVARDIVVTDWTPDDVSGYMMDSYGALWPFGQKTPIAATGVTGAPFGLFPLGPGTTVFNGFQMWSANGLPFGLGGEPNGFGYMISMDGVIVGWGGPVTGLAQPWSNLGGVGLSVDGTPGQNTNCVRDFKVNPDGSGEYYVLFESGYVFNGGPPGKVVSSAQPSPSNVSMATANGYRFMHVEWGKWIISFKKDGTPWGYNITGNGGENYPPLPVPPPWLNNSAGPPPGGEGYWQDGELIPARGPTHIWMIASTGGVGAQVIVGALSISGLTVTGATTTTRPTVSWTYSETLSVAQQSYNVRVYPTAYLSTPGFTAGQNAGAVWISDRTSTTASDTIRVDLVNGTAYTAYVRVTSAAGVTTAWSSVAFTMAIPLPAAPSSCTTVATPGTYPTTFGSIAVTAGGALPASCTRQFQVSSENGAWEDVIGASATTSSTVTDLYPPTAVNLTYRVRNVKRVPAVIASAWTLSADTVLNPSSGQPPYGWYLIDTQGLSGPNRVQIRVKAWKKTDIELYGEFYPLTRNAAVKTTAGVKGTLHAVTIMLSSKADADSLAALLKVTRPLLFETQYGWRWWVSPRPGDWSHQLTSPTAFFETIDLELLEVVRPT